MVFIGEADALSDGERVYISSVMEHVELAGVHSGDSACIIPPVTITKENLATIKDYTRKIAESLHVCGHMNMQYAIEDGKVFVLEANPRASRTVPLVSKVCNTQMARLATRLVLGEMLEDLKLKDKKLQKPLRLGHVQVSLPATLGFRVFNHHGAKEAADAVGVNTTLLEEV